VVPCRIARPAGVGRGAAEQSEVFGAVSVGTVEVVHSLVVGLGTVGRRLRSWLGRRRARARLSRVADAVRCLGLQLEPDLLALLDEAAAPAVGERVDQEQPAAVLTVGVDVEVVLTLGVPVRRSGKVAPLVRHLAAQCADAQGQGEPVAAARVHDGVGGEFADQQFGDVHQVLEAVFGEPFADEFPGLADRGLSRAQDRGAAIAHGRQAAWTVVRHGRFPSAPGAFGPCGARACRQIPVVARRAARCGEWGHLPRP
jgi:hypothetical protein